uniref:Cytochrome P450 n=1 Tax=Panagrellus redivivus TaxID=6233 RepID=A0A7E4VMU3_PANRE
MGLSFWVGVAVVTLIAFYWKRVFDFIRNRRKFNNEISKFPGPPALPLVGSTYLFKWNVQEFTDQIFEWAGIFMNEMQGACCLWLGPFPVICALRPEFVKAILESNKVLTKGKEYSIIQKWLGTGLLTSTGDKWRGRRKMLTPAFHFNVLNSFMSIYDREAQILIDVLEKEADTGKVFNFFPYVKRCALDIICDTSMGMKVNAQTNPQHPYVMSVQRLNELSFTYVRLPWMWFPPIWYASGCGTEYDTSLKLVTNFTRQVIEERGTAFRASKARGEELNFDDAEYVAKKRYAFLDLLLSVQDEGKLTDEDIREEVDTFMFEGHDTTSSGMTWAVWNLAHSPSCQEKVFEELDAVFGDSDRPCTNDDLKELKYLEKCIKETLRLFPPVPFYTRSVEEDFDFNGLNVPAGATILIPPFVLHRDNASFPDATNFNPDHFDQEHIKDRHPFAYVPFSAGPRNCIGQRFALMEEKTVLSWFFRKYRVEAGMPWKENKPLPEIITKPAHGTPIRLYRRNRQTETQTSTD